MKFYDGSKRFWIVVSVFGVIVAILGWFTFLAIKQRRDMAAVREYVSRVQPQLDADPRFKDVRLLGYSCDYIMHPYMPVLGTVPTQRDWEALGSFIRDSKPPFHVTLNIVYIGSNQEPPSIK
jgi:extradiol dioxygenase family protein